MLLRRKTVSRREINRYELELWSKQFDFTQKSKGKVSVAKNNEFIEENMRNHRMRRFIAINGQDCASFDESSQLSRVRSIADEALGCCHVVCFEEMCCLIYLSDLNPTNLD